MLQFYVPTSKSQVIRCYCILQAGDPNIVSKKLFLSVIQCIATCDSSAKKETWPFLSTTSALTSSLHFYLRLACIVGAGAKLAVACQQQPCTSALPCANFCTDASAAFSSKFIQLQPSLRLNFDCALQSSSIAPALRGGLIFVCSHQ